MLKIFIVFVCFIPGLVLADFIANAGLQGGNLESENSSHGKPVLRSPQLGFKGEIEFGSPWITAFGSVDIGTGTGRTQYNYTNPDNALDTATVDNVRGTMTLYRLSGGVRVRLIKLKRFRVFIGGGIHYGMLNLTHDEDNFESKNGSLIGFEENERNNLKGGFGEAGMEIIFTENSGIRLTAQRSSMKTDQYKTLGNEKLKFDYTSFSLNYIEYIETGKW